MVHSTTVEHEQKKDAEGRDFAPGSGREVAHIEASAIKTIHPKGEKLFEGALPTRDKTAGEVLFDISLYGGIMWGVNEVLSTIIGRGIMKGDGIGEKLSTQLTKQPGYLKRHYDGIIKGLPNNMAGGIAKQAVNIFILTIGGNLLVPIAKFLEDRKGKIVRFADGFLERKDPAHAERLEHAHTEMDQAPKQSWSSLWEGRITVLLAAVGIDLVAGGAHAPSTKLFENTPLKNWSSMTRASASFSRHTTAMFRPSMRETIAQARMLSPHQIIETVEHEAVKHLGKDAAKKVVEGKGMGFLADNSFVLVLSAATAFCFYLTSKFFAKKREENKKDDAPETKLLETTSKRAYPEQLEVAEAKATDAPSTRIANPHTFDRLAAAPQPSMQAVG